MEYTHRAFTHPTPHHVGAAAGEARGDMGWGGGGRGIPCGSFSNLDIGYWISIYIYTYVYVIYIVVLSLV